MKNDSVIFYLLFALISHPLFASPISLRSNSLFYQNDEIVASQNVLLQMGELEINTDKIVIDTKENTAISTGNITLKRKDDQFNTAKLEVDLEEEAATLHRIDIALMPPEKKGAIFLKAKELTDTEKYKKGKSGLATTCTKAHHYHHFIWAQRFYYHPDKHIDMYNVLFYNELLFVPIPIWIPYYRYHLGKRKWVWNFPTIGKKEKKGWGWFVQNTIDYKHENKKDSSILIDWFEADPNYRQGQLGGGIRHHYNWKNTNGSLYYYNYNYSDRTSPDSPWRKKSNTTYALKNNYKMNDFWTLNTSYQNIDVEERINSTGSDRQENKTLTLTYDDFGNTYKTNTYEKHNIRNKIKTSYINFDHTFNRQKRYHLNYKKNLLFSQSRRNTDASGEYRHTFKSGSTFKSSFNYLNKLNNWNEKSTADERLKSYLTFKKKLTDELKLTVKVDHLIDLDSQDVTSDESSNEFLYKHPEITLDYSKKLKKSLSLKQTTIIARYQEGDYSSLKKKITKFPESNQFNTAPNTYIFKNTVKGHWKKKNHTFNTSIGYDQYVFKLENKGLFEGDAQYALKFNTSMDSHYFNFIKHTTSYQSAYTPIENNSPFTKINKISARQNQLSKGLTFYLFDESKYSWRNTTSYSWILKGWDYYITQILVRPNKKFKLTIDSGQNLSPKSDYEKKNRYKPLKFDMNVKPSKTFKLDYNLSYDLNRYTHEKKNYIHYSTMILNFGFGQKMYNWRFKAYFKYNTRNQYGKFESTRYELQTLSLVKKEHKRTLEISYTNSKKEVFFKYTFDAFPSDPIEVRKTDNIWKLEGKFNQKSKERFTNG